MKKFSLTLELNGVECEVLKADFINQTFYVSNPVLPKKYFILSKNDQRIKHQNHFNSISGLKIKQQEE